MICQLELDVGTKKENFAKDFFYSISFVKNVKILKEREINPPQKTLKRIRNYESDSSNNTDDFFGMWKDRDDMENVEQYIKNLRKGRQLC